MRNYYREVVCKQNLWIFVSIVAIALCIEIFEGPPSKITVCLRSIFLLLWVAQLDLPIPCPTVSVNSGAKFFSDGTPDAFAYQSTQRILGEDSQSDLHWICLNNVHGTGIVQGSRRYGRRE